MKKKRELKIERGVSYYIIFFRLRLMSLLFFFSIKDISIIFRKSGLGLHYANIINIYARSYVIYINSY